jgi:hypothetical protein
VTHLDELDESALRNLAVRKDALGVVSVYAHLDARGDRQAAGIDVKNRYRRLEQQIESGDRSDEIGAALERLRPEVERLTRPSEPGRGRIGFFALDSGWSLLLDTQMPVPNRVVLDDGPFLHPLVELLDEGRPAGVVVASGDSARLFDWRMGKLELLTELERQENEAPHERAGQLGGGPSGQYHTPMGEHRQDRQTDLAMRFLGRVGQAVDELAGQRQWERILISGGERWTEPLARSLPETLDDLLIRDARVLTGFSEEELRQAVTGRLHEDHLARERQVVDMVRKAGLSGTGALGLSEVTAALNEARVTHLVYDPRVRYVGSVALDGTLYAEDEAAPGGDTGSPETRLTERIVERALATGARVSPVEGAADDALSDALGIAALLRW